MKRVKVQVRADLNVYQLAALFKDAVCAKSDSVFPSMVLDWAAADRNMPSRNYPQVKVLVAQQLQRSGEDSVNCGPQNEWTGDVEEQWYLRHVTAVYKLEEA